LARWLDALDETGRWALLKLVTGGLRIGVSARLAKTAAAALGDKEPNEVEIIWPGLVPPYTELFDWLEGRGDKPKTRDAAPFRPAMLAHAIEETDFSSLDPNEFIAEWKWDGTRIQAVAGVDEDGKPVQRLYSRTGEDISKSFPDLLDALKLPGAIDGELLIVRDGRVQSFNVLQQRLNRKAVNAKLLQEFPAHIRAYDLLVDEHEDLRDRPFAARREKLEAFVQRLNDPRIDISPVVPFESWEALTAARADPGRAGAGEDAEAVEGVMLKRRDSAYLPGRPKGPWWKWKRDPMIVDAVLMYAQRGHGKRSSYYSDYTFGVWMKGANGDELVPVGKAYFGFILARVEFDFRAQSRYGDELEVALSLESFGRTSFTYSYEIHDVATGALVATARTVLVRFDYDRLTALFGISATMADPKLELFNGSAVKIGESDNWGGDQALIDAATAVGAFNVTNAASLDAALLVTLAPGSYSARVAGVGGGGGVVIVEVYEVP